MQTDRPDATESAYTVAAGHFQLETDLFKQVRNKDERILNIENSYNIMNLKLGLTENSDLQIVVPTYVTSVTKDRQTKKIIEQQQGFEDMVIRFKRNLWGNAGGKTALALLPFLTLPTASAGGHSVGGGLVVPFAWEISEKWNFCTQLAYQTEKEDDDQYHSSYLYSFSFGRSLGKNLDSFTEMLVNYSMYSKRLDTYANGGLIFSVTDNLNLDAGINYGIKAHSARSFFTGVSFRL